MMHRYTRQFSILFMCMALTVSSAIASASGADDAKAGLAALQRGEYDEAIRLFTRTLESGELSGEQRTIVLSSRGRAWYFKKDYDHAIADYSDAIRLNPQDAKIFYSRGAAWYLKKDYDHAIADYSDAIRLNQQDAQAFNNRGLAWSEKRDYDHAIADFSEAIRLNPHLAQPFDNRGRAWYLKKDYNRAIADFSEAIRLNPQYVKAFDDRGFVQFRQARFGLATTDFAQAQKLNPDDAYVAIWLYLARARGGAKDAASQLSSNAKRFKANKWPAPLVALFTGKIDPKTAWDQAANTDSQVQKNQMCEANFYVGQWHLLKRQNEEARALFRQAQDECPRSFFEYDGAVAELNRM